MTEARKSTPGHVRAIDGDRCRIPYIAWWSYDAEASPFDVTVLLDGNPLTIARNHLFAAMVHEHRAALDYEGACVTFTPRRGNLWIRVDDRLGSLLHSVPFARAEEIARWVRQLAPRDERADWDTALKLEVLRDA